MALDIIYDGTSGMLRIVGSGVVTMEDYTECFRRVFTAPEYAATRHILFNVSGITSPLMDGDVSGILTIIKSIRLRIPGRMAIVNTRVGHVTISHIIALSSDPTQRSVRAFLVEEDAQAWLLG